MAVGEAASLMPAMAGMYSLINPSGKPVTVEASLEGKSGDFYGGWGFYFARQYLSESLESDSTDDPMNGYAESVSGTYIPMGDATDKLMVYDLNRIYDDPQKGRNIIVPDGVNFRSITLHKAIVGGNPDDPEDMAANPGCILINVPKFKVHGMTLFTNIIKNLGIGLWPMQSTKKEGHKWDYGVPHNPFPSLKGGIPHEVWVPEIDDKTNLPKRDDSARYILHKTGGITATMIDIISAVKNQNIYMMHIVDGIETINFDHTGTIMSAREPEGMVFASQDPVSGDLLCARYMFSNVPMKEAIESGIDDANGGNFPQEVPVPMLEDNNIVTEKGFDCPLSRDICFQKAEERGLGQRKYYVVGKDIITDSPLVSVKGHLGRVEGDTFSDLITKTLYCDLSKIVWDMQKTSFKYMEIVDELEGLSLKNDFLKACDENGDGIISYEEFGKRGVGGCLLNKWGESWSWIGLEKLGYLKAGFTSSTVIKYGDPKMNPDGHDVFKDLFISATIVAAYQISQIEEEIPDPFVPERMCGKGKWPSFQLAKFIQTGGSLYGSEFPNRVVFPSLYGAAFAYADYTQNEGHYVGKIRTEPIPDAVDRYISTVSENKEKLLDFTFYVPEGFDGINGTKLPNIEVTSDPEKMLTVHFNKGEEVWM